MRISLSVRIAHFTDSCRLGSVLRGLLTLLGTVSRSIRRVIKQIATILHFSIGNSCDTAVVSDWIIVRPTFSWRFLVWH